MKYRKLLTTGSLLLAGAISFGQKGEALKNPSLVMKPNPDSFSVRSGERVGRVLALDKDTAIVAEATWTGPSLKITVYGPQGKVAEKTGASPLRLETNANGVSSKGEIWRVVLGTPSGRDRSKLFSNSVPAVAATGLLKVSAQTASSTKGKTILANEVQARQSAASKVQQRYLANFQEKATALTTQFQNQRLQQTQAARQMQATKMTGKVKTWAQYKIDLKPDPNAVPNPKINWIDSTNLYPGSSVLIGGKDLTSKGDTKVFFKVRPAYGNRPELKVEGIITTVGGGEFTVELPSDITGCWTWDKAEMWVENGGYPSNRKTFTFHPMFQVQVLTGIYGGTGVKTTSENGSTDHDSYWCWPTSTNIVGMPGVLPGTSSYTWVWHHHEPVDSQIVLLEQFTGDRGDDIIMEGGGFSESTEVKVDHIEFAVDDRHPDTSDAYITSPDITGTRNLEVRVHWWFDATNTASYFLAYFLQSPVGTNRMPRPY